MHLFVSQPSIIGNTLVLHEERVIHYMGRVLRMKPGDICMIQWEHEGVSTRWNVQINEITKKSISATILGSESNKLYTSGVSLLIALPNTFSKLETIVKKCTEVGVDYLYLWRAERSLLKTVSPKRLERLRSIALESVEQCKRWSIPGIELVDSPGVCLENKTVYVFDFIEDAPSISLQQPCIGVVGPEGHFGERDYASLKSYTYTNLGLGKHILRTETAAIVGGRYLVNQV